MKKALKWIKSLLSRQRRDQEQLPSPAGGVREFIYLDEVSVYSLYASRLGMLDEQSTESRTRSTQASASGSVQGDLLVASGSLSSQLTAKDDRSTQVIRKSIIQSTFRRLYSEIQEYLVLSIASSEGPPKGLRGLNDLVENIDQCWIVDPKSLVRGTLVEMNVSLDAEAVFRFHSTMSSVLDIVKNHPKFQKSGDIGEALLINEMLKNMLVGLVPIRATSTDYVVLSVSGRELIVHRAVVSALPDAGKTEPLQVVGVADQSLFWKDTRRLLFSRYEYSTLARIGRSGLQPSWAPVKLVEGIGRMFPPIEEALAHFNQNVEEFAQGRPSQVDTAKREGKSRLVSYARSLGGEHGVDAEQVSEEMLEAKGLLVFGADLGIESSTEDWRGACQPITDYVERISGKNVSREVASRLRFEAQAVLKRDGGEASTGSRGVETPPARDEHLLDVEFIAMYW